MSDRLRESLRELADLAEPVDLYDRAMRRSRHIGRREAVIGTAAALLALGLLVSGLWRLPDGKRTEVPHAAFPHRSAAPAVPVPASRSSEFDHGTPEQTHRATGRPEPPRVPTTGPEPTARPAKPRSHQLTDLPGHVFYRDRGERPDVIRMSPGRRLTETVLPDAPSPVGISPDGRRIAYAEDGALLVTRDGTDQPERVATGVATADQAPAWSPAGDRLLVVTDAPVVLEVASGALTRLSGALGQGQQFRWSGDGSKLVFATSYCALAVAGSEAGATPQAVQNPEALAACRPTSVDATGRRVTVPLDTDGETADAVIDTVTGEQVRLPVAGTVVGAAFDPDGNLLVRTVLEGVTRLSLFEPDGTLKVQAVEPASVTELDLLAYTR